jgi:hypothetical protein
MLALEPIKMDKKPEAEEFDEFKVIKYFFRKKATPEMKVLVRPHPRQSLEKIKKLVEKEAENARIEYEFTGNEPINELLAVSDEVAGTTSTVLVIAMKLGIKISSIMPGASRKRVFAAPNILKPYIET